MNLSQLSQAYASGRLSTAEAIQALERRSAAHPEHALSEGQKGLWVLQRMEPETTAYNVPIGIECAAGTDVERLREAFVQVLRRHPLLNARVSESASGPGFDLRDAEHFTVVQEDGRDWSPETMSARLRWHATQPFRLDAERLVRMILIAAPAGRTCALIVAHHIVLDGASSALLLSQWLRAYHALAQGHVPAIASPQATYDDFVRWEQAWIASEAGRQAAAYWRTQLAGLPPLVGMPLEEPWTPALGHRNGKALHRAMPAALVDAIDRYSASHGISRAVLLLGAFKILLFRYTGQQDIAVGMPVLGRPQARFDEVLGHFINMLPIRMLVEGESSTADFLGRLQRTVADAIDHAAYPFSRQVSGQNAHDANLSAPLFQNSFNYQNFAQADWIQALQAEFSPSLRFESLHEMVQTGEYELCLDVLPVHGLTLCFKYHGDLYADATIAHMADHFMQLVQAMTDAASERIDRLPLTDARERQRLLDMGHLQAHVWPDRDATFHDLFLRQVEARPAAPAVSCGDITLDYRRLDAACQRVADALTQRGVGPGASVGLYTLRSIEMLVGLLAIARTGAAYVPLDPEYPAERLAYMVEDSGCRVILGQEALQDTLSDICPPAGVEIVFFERIAPASGRGSAAKAPAKKKRSAKARASSPAALAYTMYTSGSTGKPKGVMIPHLALTNFLLSMQQTLSFGAKDTLLAVTTYSFDIAGLELYLPLIGGGHCVICETETTRDAERLRDLLAEVRPTLMQATPMTWHMLFKVGWRNEQGVRLLCGGEAMTYKLKQLFMDRGCDVWNMYGPTETTIWSTMQHVRADRPVSIGRPIHNTRAYILDTHLEPVPVGVPGELWLAGDGVALGYHKQPALTAERFIASPFDPAQKLYRTGDLARWRRDGEIDLIGRVDHQVKVNGFRIELGEIERVLNAYTGIENSAVLLQRGAGADRLSAYYVARSGATPTDARTLQAHLRLSLPDYMIPSAFAAVASFPLTPNGKIDRLRLAASDDASVSAPPEPSATRPSRSASALENSVRAVFMDVLQREQVERDERFFDLGGNSYSAILVVDRINALFDCRIGVTALFKHPTVETLARLLQSLVSDPPQAAVAAGLVSGAAPAAVDSSGVAQRAASPAQEAALRAVPADAVAIVGISCQFPGAADHRAYWRNLIEGQDAIRFADANELRRWGIDQALIDHPDFVPQQASIDGKDQFDPAFFNISPRDAGFMDPQARLLLMHAWKAVEDAGYNVEDIPDTSVFMSAGNHFYQAQWPELVAGTTQIRVMHSADEYVAWLLAQGGSLPTMVSNKLGLTGPSVYVSTNCSSSLSGLHLACQSLLTREVDQALVGASGVFPAHSLGYVHQPGLNFASDGHCRSFDARADGMVGGEGVAVLMLKLAVDALRDGDDVYAWIRGTAINNDGAEKAGFYAPSIQGQTAVIRKVLKKTGIDPTTVRYVEAHGTGTRIGDPIEVAALTEAYRQYTDRTQFCAIGSVKSNIGHLDAAAGMAGLVKLAMGLRHGEIPRTLHFERPNPDIDFVASPFYVLTQNLRLDDGVASPVRAAISSFGIGGTNGHAILEQAYPTPARRDASRIDGGGLFVLSAQTMPRLKERVSELLAFLVTYREQGGLLTDMLYTLQVGRKPMACRVAFPVDSLDAFAQALSDYLGGHAPVPGLSEGDTKASDRTTGAMFDDPDETAQWIRQWWDKGQWQKLGMLWTQGVSIDWRALHSQPGLRRVHLPAYPFARKSYGMAQARNAASLPPVVAHVAPANAGFIDNSAIRVGPADAGAHAPATIVALAERLDEEAANALARLSGPQGIRHMLEDRRQRAERLNRMLGRLLLTQLRTAGLFEDATPLAPDEIDAAFDLSDAHRRWLRHSLDILSQAGLLRVSNGRYAPLSGTPDKDAWSAWTQFKNSGDAPPETAGRVPLLETMLRALPQILRGGVAATQAMFPDGSLTLVEGVYKRNVVADYFNGMAAQAAQAFVRERLAQSPQAPIRILEIGAGTGSTSEHMFSALSGVAPAIAEYVYTDLSKAFLVQAEKRFGPDVPYLRYKAFDVEKAPDAQGLDAASFDLVVATNVLHATRNMRRTLTHAKRLLRRNGVLLINEIVENDLGMHLTFGLLDGWWKYDDGERRLPGGPALSSSAWRALLAELGFHTVLLPTGRAEDLGLQLILAQSDGRREPMPDDASPPSASVPRPVASRTLPAPGVARAGLAATASDARVTDAVVAQLAASLQLEIDEVRHDESFSDYGLDSLTGVNLVKQLNQTLGIALDTTALYDHPTVNRLRAHILSHFGSVLGQVPDAADRPAFAVAAADRRAAEANDADRQAIAIVGMSGRFPQTDDVETFWTHLAQGRDLVEPVRRWDVEAHAAQCRAGGFLRDIAHFDPLFFNISGLEAAYMEPQQRIFLEEAWMALEDAGYAGEGMDQKRCGVYVGCTNGDYLDLGSQASYPAQAFWGNMSSVVPSRIAYYLNLHGPALAIDTACSSSLVAIHLAAQALRSGEVEMAIAGGVFVQCSPRLYIAGSRAGMLSPSGHCHSFDDRADGFVPAEGAGALVLKRLSDALADGDHIHGVIRGSGINQDGTTNGITAPSAVSQQRLQEQVYADFGIGCESIQMIEAHGTGTKLGDPIEFQALTRAFRSRTDKRAFCALGSSKANIGHAQMAAGVIGVIKILLALRHGQIPPLAKFAKANADIALEGSPFYVNTDLIPWNTDAGHPRRAAISSFGASGTNAHMVIEQAPALLAAARPLRPELILLSARTAAQVRRQAECLRRHCRTEGERLALADVGYTLCVGRRHFAHRLAVIAETPAQLERELGAWLDGSAAGSPTVFASAPTASAAAQAQQASSADPASFASAALTAWAQAFVRGERIDTELLFADGDYRRTPLPSDPFEREYHWAEDKFLSKAIAAPAPAPAPAPASHADTLLLRRGVASAAGETAFEVTLDPQAFYLRDHAVRGQPILPASVYLELARLVRASLEDTGQQTFGLKNLVLLRPVSDADARVRVVAGAGASHSFELRSAGTTDPERLHCRAEFVADPGRPPPPLDLSALRAQAVVEETTGFYADFAQIGIDYGPAFQGVRALYTHADGVLARLELPPVVAHTLADMPIHPTMVDCAMQCLKYLRDPAADRHRARLMFSIREIAMHAPCTAAMWAWIRHAPTTEGSATALRRIDIDMSDDQGRICLSIRGVSTRAPAAEAAPDRKAGPAAIPTAPAPQTMTNTAAMTLLPVWEPSPEATGTRWPSADARVALMCGDARIRPQWQAAFPGLLHLEADRIEAWQASNPPLEHLFWVAPAPAADALHADTVIEDQAQGVIALLRLLKTLIGSGYGRGDFGLTVVTRGSLASHPLEPCDPTHAGIAGLMGAVAKEYPNWRIRVVDAHDGDLDDVGLDALLKCAPDRDGNPRLYRQRQWFAQRLLPLHSTPVVASRFRHGGVYVIAGGAGGLGRAISDHLIRRHRAQVVWLGRSAPDARIAAHIAALSAEGPAPCYVQVDAADAVSMRRARETIVSRFGPVHGLIQSALVLEGASIQRMSERQFTDVLRAKVDVSMRLIEAFADDPLDLVLFISSINAYLKAMGQGNYAAGCCFKDALALRLAQTGRADAKVINLGYCFNNLESDQGPRAVDKAGMDFIDREELMAGLETLCASSFPQMTLMKFSPSQNTRGIHVGSETVLGHAGDGLAAAAHSSALGLLSRRLVAIDASAGESSAESLARILERMKALNALAI